MQDASPNSLPKAARWFALAMGLFLGLSLLKFGNPVILDQQLDPPRNLGEWWSQPWPIRWANTLLTVVTAAGFVFLGAGWFQRLRQMPLWISIPPVLWLGWQFLSARHSLDPVLTGLTMAQLSGCVVCFFLGSLVLPRGFSRSWVWIGLMAALCLVLLRGVQQQFGELRQEYRALVEGERTGWKDVPQDTLASMERDGVLVRKDGRLVANEAILIKLKKGRINATLVYPNALAGVILMLGPAAMTMAFRSTATLRPAIRWTAFGLSVFLCCGCLYWTGSKAGWLIAMAMAGVALLEHASWPASRKWLAVACVAGLGMGVFALRFGSYFKAGATSAGARLDYWRAAVAIARQYPVFGTGPGTFQRPYARIKSPEAEMARLAHNDYLQQASDSGWVGFLAYLVWIGGIITLTYRSGADPVAQAGFLGLAGWFSQGLVEFSLYIPALAWTAFTLAGLLVNERAFPPRRDYGTVPPP